MCDLQQRNASLGIDGMTQMQLIYTGKCSAWVHSAKGVGQAGNPGERVNTTSAACIVQWAGSWQASPSRIVLSPGSEHQNWQCDRKSCKNYV